MKYTITSLLLGFSILALAQGGNDSASSFAKNILSNSKEIEIGIYTGPNFSVIKPLQGYPKSDIGIGYNSEVMSKLKSQSNLIFNCGIIYEMQYYHEYLDKAALIYGNNDNHTLNSNIYYIGIPLSAGYSFVKKKWSFDLSFGVEFYYNFLNNVAMYDATTDKIIYQETSRPFQKSYNGYNGWPIGVPSSVRIPWYTIGVFGMVNGCLNYKISSLFSLSLMPVIRFTDPFMATPFEESFITSRGLANTSLTVGLNYKFSIDDIGGSFLPKDEDLYEIAIGFSLIPSFNFGPNSGSYIPDRASKIFSFSYAFPMQFYLSEHFAFESGLAIDNFNENNEYTTNVLIGIPITLRYYFSKNVEKGRAYYIDIGTHIDYHLNDGVAGTPVSYIMPLVLAKIGYEIKLGTNYFLNTDIGYEHELAYLRLSDNIGRAPAYNQLPYIFSGSIGFSYKFKKK